MSRVLSARRVNLGDYEVVVEEVSTLSRLRALLLSVPPKRVTRRFLLPAGAATGWFEDLGGRYVECPAGTKLWLCQIKDEAEMNRRYGYALVSD